MNERAIKRINYQIGKLNAEIERLQVETKNTDGTFTVINTMVQIESLKGKVQGLGQALMILEDGE